MSTPQHRRAGWSWPRTLAVATLAIFGALLGAAALPFLIIVLLDLPTGVPGMLGGLWLGLCIGAWVGLRMTR